MPTSKTNSLLGYPADARLLLINADDFGMCHAVNEGILRSIKDGVVHSTSLMPTCPWTLHAIQLLRENPDIPFGVHLNLICDQANYLWATLTPKEKVPTLIDERGYCYSIERMAEFLTQANLAEVEMEFRAQIELVLGAGLKPTHLDWHCLHSGGRADIFELTFALAREYGLALRVANHPYIENVQGRGLPTDDYDLLDSYSLEIPEKSAQYIKLLRDLPTGLTEWAVHPALGNAELQAMEAGSWRIRSTDFEFVMSAEAREVIQQEGIILLDYRPLQAVWQGAPA